MINNSPHYSPFHLNYQMSNPIPKGLLCGSSKLGYTTLIYSIEIQKFAKMDDIYCTFKFFLVFSKFLGFFPLTFVGDGPKWKSTVIDKIWTLICISMLICCASYCAYSCTQYPSLRIKIWYIILVIGYGCIFFQFFYQLFKMKKIQHFFKIISSCDTIFASINVSLSSNKEKIIVSGILTFIISIIIIYTGVSLLMESVTGYELHFFYSWYLVYQTLFVFQFFIPAFIISRRISKLQNLLR